MRYVLVYHTDRDNFDPAARLALSLINENRCNIHAIEYVPHEWHNIPTHTEARIWLDATSCRAQALLIKLKQYDVFKEVFYATL